MSGRGAPLADVEVVDEETIVERGTRKVTWFVRVADAWVHASNVAGAVITDEEAGPGTVWGRRTVLRLAAGTRLMRVETRPRPHAYDDPFAYLRREVRDARRKTHRSEYLVTARGALAPARGSATRTTR